MMVDFSDPHVQSSLQHVDVGTVLLKGFALLRGVLLQLILSTHTQIHRERECMCLCVKGYIYIYIEHSTEIRYYIHIYISR